MNQKHQLLCRVDDLMFYFCLSFTDIVTIVIPVPSNVWPLSHDDDVFLFFHGFIYHSIAVWKCRFCYFNLHYVWMLLCLNLVGESQTGQSSLQTGGGSSEQPQEPPPPPGVRGHHPDGHRSLLDDCISKLISSFFLPQASIVTVIRLVNDAVDTIESEGTSSHPLCVSHLTVLLSLYDLIILRLQDR